MTCVKGACDVGHRAIEPLQKLGLEAHAQLPSHQPVPLLFHQQRHHPIRLNLASHIPSKLFNAECKPSLEPSASFALSAISKPLNRTQQRTLGFVVLLGAGIQQDILLKRNGEYQLYGSIANFFQLDKLVGKHFPSPLIT